MTWEWLAFTSLFVAGLCFLFWVSARYKADRSGKDEGGR